MFAINLIRFAIKRCGFHLPDSVWLSALGYLCSGVLAFVFSVVVSLVLRKLFPRAATVLFGGR